VELDNAADAAATLDRIAGLTPPIAASFGPVVRFPGTNTFALTLMDERPVLALHRAIAESEPPFGSSPYPFKPHCTLTSGIPVSDDDGAGLLAIRVPGTVVLDHLSVYAMTSPIHLLHRVELRRRDKG
jgi:hypothetical protein